MVQAIGVAFAWSLWFGAIVPDSAQAQSAVVNGELMVNGNSIAQFYNGVIMVDQQSGADLCAKIATAYAYASVMHPSRTGQDHRL